MRADSIVLHHSLTRDGKTVSWGPIRKWHTGLHPESPYVNDPMIDIGYHAGIELIGDRHEILVGRMFDEDGAHCRQQGMNRRSLGVLLIGNFDLAPPPIDMWTLAIRFVRSMCDVLYIPRNRVYGHREFTSYKTCPGRLFDLDRFRSDLLNAA